MDLTSWAVEVEGREDEDDGFECPSRSRSVGDGEECFLQLLGEETTKLTELANEKRSNCVWYIANLRIFPPTVFLQYVGGVFEIVHFMELRGRRGFTRKISKIGQSGLNPSRCELPTTLVDSWELGKQHSSTKYSREPKRIDPRAPWIFCTDVP